MSGQAGIRKTLLAEAYKLAHEHPDRALEIMYNLLLNALSPREFQVYEYVRGSTQAVTSKKVAGRLNISHAHACNLLRVLVDLELVAETQVHEQGSNLIYSHYR
jgi:predicted transcriptional regulator